MTTLPADDALGALADWVRAHPKLFVLTGAGCSTDSGIPDYRDQAGRWKRKPPVYHQDFLRFDDVRRRYWARSMMGWRLMVEAAPNAGHHALSRLEGSGYLHQLVTQNVDGLHQRAGSVRVIDLHGNVGQVVCLDCQARHARARVQAMLEADNPDLMGATALAAPDGDAEFESEALARFLVPGCPACGGMLKPDLVFFGDTVPRSRVQAAMDALEAADAILVVGSSLAVYSGFRFCLRGKEQGIPIAAINLGRTRADDMFSLKVERSCAQALVTLAARLKG